MTTREDRTTRSVMVMALALALAWLGCSRSEPPPTPAAPASSVATAAAAAPAPGPTMSPRRPAVTIPAIQKDPSAEARALNSGTPCDRHESGWKWVGTVVENGQCSVGPCSCVKE